MNLGRVGRVGRMIVGRAGRLVIALALAGVLLAIGSAAPAATPASALVCQMKPTRIGWRCFCRGAYGWRTAPRIMCRVAR